MGGSKKSKKRDLKLPQLASQLNPREIINKYNPDAFYEMNPRWDFNMCDTKEWKFDKAYMGDLFWSEVLPRMKAWEKMKWKDIFADAKNNHPIKIPDLTKKARDRLDEMHIEAEAVYSLRFTGTHRFYGLIDDGTFHIIWFDKDHGDNEDCVCRCHKKYT